MRKSSIAILVVLAFAAAALMGTMAVAQDTKSGKVEDTFKIKDPIFKKYKKVPVNFTHKQHSVDLKIKCTDCHHVYKDGKNVWKDGDKAAKCSSCHNTPKKNQKVGGVKVYSAYNAYHKNCRTCHKAFKKQDKKSKAPTKCNQCHPKKK
jgi:cytochrome c553